MCDDKDQRCENTNRMLQALAGLDPAPNWSCTITPDLITWTRETADRRVTVLWNKHSRRNYSWVAESEPLDGKGRRRTLSRSAGSIGYADSDKQLRQFFS